MTIITIFSPEPEAKRVVTSNCDDKSTSSQVSESLVVVEHEDPFTFLLRVRRLGR